MQVGGRGGSREMAGPMNEMVKAARAKGVFIIHAPSSVHGFLQGHAAAQAAPQAAPFATTPVPLATTERWGTAWCWPDGKREGVLPIDDSDMGCDCAVEVQDPRRLDAADRHHRDRRRPTPSPTTARRCGTCSPSAASTTSSSAAST